MKFIYNKKGNKLIEPEHVIYISNIFIKKLGESEQNFIDRTFVFPKGFKQIIIILTKDMITQKRYPCCFGLINNKSEVGYIEFFKSLKNIITIENTKN